ncbi:MAG: ribosomal protein S18-alanine N-acetyltransferase [Candidatus Aminicenantes bacterium]|nr:ribosomal protein S18-alanine N-acetyltransferase [Candidatus Aminicenantes bacterium]
MIRRMEEKDLPAVLAIERASFPNPWHESTFRGEIQNRSISFPWVIVHESDNQVVGYVIFWKIGEEVQINNIAIHPNYRRRGLGEWLLRKVISKVKKDGAQFITLEVRQSNLAAQALYSKLGFKLVGRRRFYYSNPIEDALVMMLDLGS